MLRRTRKYFFSGLTVFLPFVLTIYVSVWLLNFFESILGKYLKPFFLHNYDFYFWGLGILILVLIILFCGFLAANYFGRAAHALTEKVFLRIPLLGNIYPAFKEIARFLFREQPSNFEQVVMVEWPRKGVYIIGFLTNMSSPKISAKVGKKMYNVLIPSVPNPLTGFVILVPEDEIIFLRTTVEEAIKIVVSGGVVNPEIADDNSEPAPKN